MTGPKDPLLDDSPYWTRQRRELLQWFNDRAPSFTAGYVAAVRLLHDPSFPARVHLVCHLVRDIYRYLPATLGLKPPRRAADVFPPLVADLVGAWDRFPPSETVSSSGIDSDVNVSSQVYRRLAKIVEQSKQMGKQPSIVGSQLAIGLFRSIDRRDDDFVHPWIIASFDREYYFFVRRAHLVQSIDKVPTDDGLREHFEAFERSFHSLVGPYFTGKEELDEILRDTTPKAD